MTQIEQPGRVCHFCGKAIPDGYGMQWHGGLYCDCWCESAERRGPVCVQTTCPRWSRYCSYLDNSLAEQCSLAHENATRTVRRGRRKVQND